jgi:hypothetical protein
MAFLEDFDGFAIFGLGDEKDALFEFGEGLGDVAPVGILFHRERDVDGHLVSAVEPADDGSEGDIDGEEYEEEIKDVGKEELHPGDVDQDEFVHEDAEIHEGKEIDEVGAVSCAEVGPTALKEAFFLCQS